MTTHPVPSIPSREAVEAVRVKLLDIHLDEAKEARDMLRDLRAEVERLTNYVEILLGSEKLARQREANLSATVAALEKTSLMHVTALENANATVSAQAAELEHLREEVAVGEQHDCDAVDIIHAADQTIAELRATVLENNKPTGQLIHVAECETTKAAIDRIQEQSDYNLTGWNNAEAQIERLERTVAEQAAALQACEKELEIRSESWRVAAAKVEEQTAALAERDKDAERYRWLRQYGAGIYDDVFNDDLTFESVDSAAYHLDEAIDAALASQPREPT